MAFATFFLLTALLAFAAQLASAAPLTWYLAPTVTSSSAAARSTTSSLVWYKADPTTSSSSVLPSSSSVAPPTSTSPVYTGTFNKVAQQSYSSIFPATIYYRSPVCPPATLPEEFKDPLYALQRGVSLSPDFYNQHGSLRKFCGKAIRIIDAANPLAVSKPFYINRGCPTTARGMCVGASLGGSAWTYGNLTRDWQAAAKEAGVEDYRFPIGAYNETEQAAVRWEFV
ncbi:hypothetical protein JCM6882_008911 [Rhodosporidiobolus microsporus]